MLWCGRAGQGEQWAVPDTQRSVSENRYVEGYELV